MSSPHAYSFMGSNVDSSSFSVISLNTWISAMSLRNCCIKSSAITSQRCATLLLDSWRALIDDNISGLFLKSRNKESAASTKASFIISSYGKDFLCLMIEWVARSNASVANFACEFHCMKNNCLPVILVPSPFSFSACFMEEVSVVLFYEQLESASQNSPSE